MVNYLGAMLICGDSYSLSWQTVWVMVKVHMLKDTWKVKSICNVRINLRNLSLTEPNQHIHSGVCDTW